MKRTVFISALVAAGTLAAAVAVIQEARAFIAGGPAAERYVREIVRGQKSADVMVLEQMRSEVLPYLIQALCENDSSLKQDYAMLHSVLPQAIGTYLPEPVPAAMIRLNAAAIVGCLGPAARPAVPQLIGLLRDDFADANAALSLGRIGPGARQAVPALVVALQEGRPGAAWALGNMGSAASAALPALEAACQNGPEWLRRQSALAIRKIREDLSRLERGHGGRQAES